jgi:hypothetical protein
LTSTPDAIKHRRMQAVRPPTDVRGPWSRRTTLRRWIASLLRRRAPRLHGGLKRAIRHGIQWLPFRMRFRRVEHGWMIRNWYRSLLD